MKPESYREQHIDCCGSCQHNIDVNGVMVPVCGFGEDLHEGSFYHALWAEENKYSRAGNRYFDQGEFSNQWLNSRWVNEWDICDEYQKAD